MIQEVSARLGARADRVRWKPVFWAPLVQVPEDELLRKLVSGGTLDWLPVRRFVVHFLADAVAYQRVPGESGAPGLYVRIHELIAEKLTQLRGELRQPGGGDPPLVVVAHSLGGHIMSNYIWDQQRPQEQRDAATSSPFVRAETLAGIVTFGCNIPLFALALPQIVPITFPPPTLAAPLRSVARWLNLYDADDVLGFPLQPLSDRYATTVKDEVVRVGGIVTGWNPLSHNAYWTDNDVTKPIAQLLGNILAQLPE